MARRELTEEVAVYATSRFSWQYLDCHTWLSYDFLVDICLLSVNPFHLIYLSK